MDSHTAVFLPKGRYRLSKTLELRNGTQLLGLSQTLSYLLPLHTGFSSHTAERREEPRRLFRDQLFRAAAPALPPSCTAVQAGTNCDGHNIMIDNPKAGTAAECCAMCQSNTACLHWTWNKIGNHICYLKSTCVPRSDANVVSGGAPPFPPAPPPAPTPPPPPASSFEPLVRTAGVFFQYGDS